MKTIWKFPLAVVSHQAVEMPEGAEVLCVQTQNGQPQAWAVVDPARELKPMHFFIYGTGHEVTALTHKRYVGTFQMHEGSLVFHAFVEKQP